MEIIEKIDEIRRRVPNATYSDARQALLDSDGDILEAIIVLESKDILGSKTKQAKRVVEDVLSKDGEEIKEFIRKCNSVRVIIEKNDKVIMNIPVTVGVVGLALGQLVTLTGLAIAIIGKCQIKIQNEEDGRVLDLGEFSEEKISMIKQAINNTAKEAKDKMNSYKKDDKDITDELIKEEDSINDEK